MLFVDNCLMGPAVGVAVEVFCYLTPAKVSAHPNFISRECEFGFFGFKVGTSNVGFDNLFVLLWIVIVSDLTRKEYIKSFFADYQLCHHRLSLFML